MTSYRVFERLQKLLPAESHGVRMRVANFFFDQPIEHNPEEFEKMCEIDAEKVSDTTKPMRPSRTDGV